MELEFVPLLEIQRQLYRIPHGMARFHEYLRVMSNHRRDDLRLPPLAWMNPMGKDHVPALLDALLALDAEGVAAQAVAKAASSLSGVFGEFKIGMVVVDDAMGGWTERYTSELRLRFEIEPKAKAGAPRRKYHHWLSGVLWTSQDPSAQAVREAAMMPIYRVAYRQQHGLARTLGEMLAQEGYVMAMAGCKTPSLDADDLAYTREVLQPQLGVHDRGAIVGCLFGDTAAAGLGYPPQGLSDGAGLALALHDARPLGED